MEKQMFSPKVLTEIKARERTEKERQAEIMRNKNFSSTRENQAWNNLINEFARRIIEDL